MSRSHGMRYDRNWDNVPERVRNQIRTRVLTPEKVDVMIEQWKVSPMLDARGRFLVQRKFSRKPAFLPMFSK